MAIEGEPVVLGNLVLTLFNVGVGELNHLAAMCADEMEPSLGVAFMCILPPLIAVCCQPYHCHLVISITSGQYHPVPHHHCAHILPCPVLSSAAAISYAGCQTDHYSSLIGDNSQYCYANN